MDRPRAEHPRSQPDEDVLVRRAQEGDGDAFRLLVERTSGDVFRLAWRLTGRRESAEDVVQEAFLKAYRGLRRFDGQSRFGTWLHAIAANCALDHLRRESRRGDGLAAPGEDADPTAELPSAEPGPVRRAAAAETRRRVAAGLGRLTPLERTAFVLRHFEGRSIREIGDVLGSGAPATTVNDHHA